MNVKTYTKDGAAWCKHCGHGQGSCVSRRPGSSALCTRPKGHDGDHIACGIESGAGHIVATWPKEETLK